MPTRSKIIVIALIIFSGAQSIMGQGYNEEKTSLANFIKRMYNNTPFEGVKVIEDYDHSYFVSLVSLEKAKYSNSSIMSRVAQVKARQQANTFFNGSSITSDLIVKTTETKDSANTSTVVEMIDSIKESSLGFIEGMELLINFDNGDGTRMVFIYYKEMQKKP